MRKGLLICIVLILLSIGPCQAARPETGAYIKDINRNGYGQLTMHNNESQDAIVVVADLDVHPLIAVYVRSGESFTIMGIKDGEYVIYSTAGKDWDSKKGTFADPRGYYKFGEPIEVKTTDLGDDVESSAFEIILWEVSLGQSNFILDFFEFPDLG